MCVRVQRWVGPVFAVKYDVRFLPWFLFVYEFDFFYVF